MRRPIVKVGLVLAALIVLNRITFAAIVPLIFFNAVYDAASERALIAEPSVRRLTVETEDGTLYGWQTGTDSETVLLYFGGDHVDSSAWLSECEPLAADTFLKRCTLLIVDYPTFGQSEGTIDEAAFYRTAASLYAYAEAAYPNARIYAMGYSIGTYAALRLSTEHALSGLILVAPMYDGTGLYLPRGTVLHDYFEQTATVQMQNDALAPLCPLRPLVIGGDADRMTRAADIDALCALFPLAPLRAQIDGAGHGDYWTNPATFAAIDAYLSAD